MHGTGTEVELSVVAHCAEMEWLFPEEVIDTDWMFGWRSAGTTPCDTVPANESVWAVAFGSFVMT